MPGENEIEISIRAQNLFSAELQKVRADIQGLTGVVESVSGGFAKLQSSLNSVLQLQSRSAAMAKTAATTASGATAIEIEGLSRKERALENLIAQQTRLSAVPVASGRAAADEAKYQALLKERVDLQSKLVMMGEVSVGKKGGVNQSDFAPGLSNREIVSQIEAYRVSNKDTSQLFDPQFVKSTNKSLTQELAAVNAQIAAAEKDVNAERTKGVALLNQQVAALQQEIAATKTLAQAKAAQTADAKAVTTATASQVQTEEKIRTTLASQADARRAARAQAAQAAREQAAAMEQQVRATQAAAEKYKSYMATVADPRPAGAQQNAPATQAWLNVKDEQEAKRRAQAWGEYNTQLERTKSLQDELRKVAPSGVFTQTGAVNAPAMAAWANSKKGVEELAKAVETLDSRYAQHQNVQAGVTARLQQEIDAHRLLQQTITTTTATRLQEIRAIQEQMTRVQAALPLYRQQIQLALPAYQARAQLALPAYQERLAITAGEAQVQQRALTTSYKQPLALPPYVESKALPLPSPSSNLPAIIPQMVSGLPVAQGGGAGGAGGTGGILGSLGGMLGGIGGIAAAAAGFAGLTLAINVAMSAWHQYTQRINESIDTTVAFNRAVLALDSSAMRQFVSKYVTDLDRMREETEYTLTTITGIFKDFWSALTTGMTRTEFAQSKIVEAYIRLGQVLPFEQAQRMAAIEERRLGYKERELSQSAYEIRDVERLVAIRDELIATRQKESEVQTTRIRGGVAGQLQTEEKNLRELEKIREQAQSSAELLSGSRLGPAADAELARAKQAEINQQKHLDSIRQTRDANIQAGDEQNKRMIIREQRMIEARIREAKVYPIETDLKISKASLQGIQSEIQMLQGRLAQTSASGIEDVLGRIKGLTAQAGAKSIEELGLEKQIEILRIPQQPRNAMQLVNLGLAKAGDEALAMAKQEQDTYDKLVVTIERLYAVRMKSAQITVATQKEQAERSAQQLRAERESYAAQGTVGGVQAAQQIAQAQEQMARADLADATTQNWRQITAEIENARDAAYDLSIQLIILQREQAVTTAALSGNFDQILRAFQIEDEKIAEAVAKRSGQVRQDTRTKGQTGRQMEGIGQQALLEEFQSAQQLTAAYGQLASARLEQAGTANWEQQIAYVERLSDAEQELAKQIAIVQYNQAVSNSKEGAAGVDERSAAIKKLTAQMEALDAQDALRLQRQEQFRIQTAKKFELDIPQARKQIEIDTGNINLATQQIGIARQQMQLQDIDLLPAAAQEGAVRATYDTVQQMQEIYRAGMRKINDETRKLEEERLAYDSKINIDHATDNAKTLIELRKKWAAEDVQITQRDLNENYQQHQEYTSRLRSLYENTPMFKGLSDQLQTLEQSVGDVLGDIMTGEFKSWEDTWNKLWKAMARNAAKYLADELFTPLKDMRNKDTADAVNSGRPVAQSGLGMLWSGAKALWDKATGATPYETPGQSAYSGVSRSTLNELSGAAGGGTSGAGIGEEALGDYASMASKMVAPLAGFQATSGMAVTTAMSAITTSMTAASTALLTAAGQLTAAAATMSASAGSSGAGALAGAAGASATQSSPYMGSGAFTVAAKGGLFTGATPVIIGEAGPEVVLPLNDKKRMVELLRLAGVRELADGGIVTGGLTGLENPDKILGVGQAQPATTVTQSGGMLFETGTHSNAVTYEDEKEAAKEATKGLGAFGQALMVIVPLLMLFGGQLGKLTGGSGGGGIGGWLASLFGGSGGSGGGGGGFDTAAWANSSGAFDSGFTAWAKGDLISKPTLGLVGEAGPELILPLTKPKRMKELLDQVGLAYLPVKQFAEGGLVDTPSVAGWQSLFAGPSQGEVAANWKSLQYTGPQPTSWREFAEQLSAFRASAQEKFSAYFAEPQNRFNAMWSGKSPSAPGGGSPEGVAGGGTGLGASGGPQDHGPMPGLYGSYPGGPMGGAFPAGSYGGVATPSALTAMQSSGMTATTLGDYYKSQGIPGYAEGGLVSSPALRSMYDTGALPFGDFRALSGAQQTKVLAELAAAGKAYNAQRPNVRVWGDTTYIETPEGGWTPVSYAWQNKAGKEYPVNPFTDTESGGRGGTGPGQTEGWGRMSPGMETAFGVLGAMHPGVAMMGWASRNIAGGYQADPMYGAPTVQDIQNAYDYEGNIAGAKAAAERAAREAQALAKDETGYTAGLLGGMTHAAPGVANPDMDTKSMQGLGTSGGMNAGANPDGTSTGTGRGSGGDGSTGGDTGGKGGGDVGGGGCFVQGTQVLLIDGTTKSVEEIIIGDRVRSWDASAKAFSDGVVVTLFPLPCAPDEARLVVTLTLDDETTITCTPAHRFLLQTGAWVEAGLLQIGATLMSGRCVSESRRDARTNTPVWNFRVEPQHTYVVEGQIVHNDKEAKGGVINARRSTNVTMGEAGETELGIFVPKSMEQKGRQGNEEQVVETMLRVLARLTGRTIEDFAIPMATGGIVTKDNTLAMLHKDEMVIPLQRGARSTDTETPGKPGSSGVTVINVFKEDDFQNAMATAVARGSRVVVNDIIAGMAGNRAIRRSIQRTT